MIGRCKCQMCKNFLTPDKRARDWKCKAFPKGIPEMKIAYIDFDSCENCYNGIDSNVMNKTTLTANSSE